MWQVILVKPNSKELQRANGTYAEGCTDVFKRCIYICIGLSQKRLEKVLTHELVHAFCYDNRIVMDAGSEEIMADFVARFGAKILQTASEIKAEL